jgi:hypothetical protein
MMLPMTQTTFVHVQLVKVDYKCKIATKILFHIFVVCYFFVPNCRTSKLVHFRLEYLFNAKNRAIG